jgi:NitT/TauT family transport system permease protein/taurine transport system permease protein
MRGLPAIQRRLLGACSLAAALLVWWIATSVFHWIDVVRFPDPATFLRSLYQIVFGQYAGANLAQHVASSLGLVLKGFVLAAATGCTLGMIMGLSPFWRDFLSPAFNLLRPVPPLAWIPLALLWFGLGDASKLFLITYAAFIPVVINTSAGVAQIDRVLLEAARVHGARGWPWLKHVIIPGAVPHIVIGLRLAMQTCWTVIVAAELLGAIYGIGKVLNSAKDDVYPGMIMVGMATVAVLGISTTYLLELAERRFVTWRR